MVLEPGLSRRTSSAYSHKNRNTAQEEIENRKKSKVKREPAEEIDLLDTMLSSLVELLEEKGILTQAEYEKRIMEKVKIK